MPHVNSPKAGGGKPDKIIRDALMAVQRQDPKRLKRIAEAWWLAAETDQTARNALADRLDGKVSDKVELTGRDGGAIETKGELSELDKVMLQQYVQSFKPMESK